MARFTKFDLFEQLKENSLVPVFYNSDIEISKKVLKACYDGGVRVFEFTNRGDFAHEVFAELNKWVAKEFPDMILGIGTVVDAATAALYLQLGANFIVGPLLSEDIFPICNRRGIAYVPGCSSASEIGRAMELGADLVKVFPGNTVGADFIKNIKGPIPWANIMVTGGVEPNLENLKKWFNAGVLCVGLASQLISNDIISNEKWDELRDTCKESLSFISQIRKKQH